MAALITSVAGLLTAVAAGWFSDDGNGGATRPGTTITGVEASLDAPPTGTFACPVTMVFEGSISIAAGTGEVSYRFVHTDAIGGAESKDAIQTVRFTGPGTAAVRHEWTPSVPEGEVFRTLAIEVLSPVTLRSADVTSTVTCDPASEAPPPIPPPDVSPPSG